MRGREKLMARCPEHAEQARHGPFEPAIRPLPARQRERRQQADLAISDVLLDLLIVVDDFERARMLAETHRMPLVDLAVTGVSPEATKLVPLRVLERVVAVPYASDETSVRVALSDPDNVHGIDELRLAAGRPAENDGLPPNEPPDVALLRRVGEDFGQAASLACSFSACGTLMVMAVWVKPRKKQFGKPVVVSPCSVRMPSRQCSDSFTPFRPTMS